MDELILWARVLLSLGAVLALVWVLQRRISQGRGPASAAAEVNVVGRQPVGPKSSVVIVETGGKRFMLGVTEHTVNVLHAEDLPASEALADAESFAGFLERTPAHYFAPSNEREGGGRRAAQPHQGHDVLHGSILSPQVWRGLAVALRQGPRS